MLEKRFKINHRQIAWMVTVILTASGFLTTPKTIIGLAKADAWLSQFLGILYGFGIAAMFYFLARRFPGKNIFEITFELLGKWGGGLCNLLYLVHFISILIRNLGVFSDFMNTTLLIRTPGEIIVLVLLLLLIYFSKSSVEVPARVNDLMYPLFFLMLLLVPLMLSNEFSFQRTEPILGMGYGPLTSGNIIAGAWYGDILSVGAFMGMVGHSKKLHAALRHGVMCTGLLMSVVLFFIIAVLGTEVSARLMYPNYSLVEQIHITDYLDRVELIMFSIWLPIFILKVSFLFIATLTLISTFTKRWNYSLYNKQYAWFALFFWAFAFQSVTEVFNFANYGAVLLTIPHIFVYIALYLTGRKRKVQVEEHDESETLPRKKKQNNRFLRWAGGKTEKTWRRTTHLCIAVMGASLLIGGGLGQYSKYVGALTGLGYLLALFTGFVSSYLEMRQMNIAAARKKQKKEMAETG
ncbi:hypothetical protein CBW65_05790 [Tumebacillus avium]|uniref:Uncharacterized protein n=1 Tax=Tumebacillus avium TaxID=1903704 RepID=A0A1Y0IKT1_9BACL|nr:endospore germination permease [Tumebacillus avium]ARU60649.1 hypothetical protein CBW65_05790 [Tumebacillus avium]